MDYSLYYSKWHNSSDAHYKSAASFYQGLLQPILTKLAEKAEILDVGCGTGLLVNALRTLGYENVKGIDLSQQQIDVARARGLPCEEVDSEHIFRLAESSAGSIDAIFLLDVLEHVAADRHLAFAVALRKLLKPDGVLVLSVPNANSSFAMRWRYNDWTHRCSFTEHSVDFVLRNAGFSTPTFFPYEFGTPPRFPYVHRLNTWTWVLRQLFRSMRRLEAIGELGRDGLHIPLGLNLLLEARPTNEIV
jgi:SAM-dependent methyltransferase